MSLHKETMFSFIVVSFSIMLPVVRTGPSVDSTYVAAVYEHNLILNPEPRVPLSRPAALQHMQKNLDIYEEQAARAAQQGAQILVFPEVGLQGYNFTRSSIFGYLETIPDPQQESWNPCTEPDKHNNTEVLQQLSCMARRNNLYLVANVADLQPCPLQTDPSSSCPSDGRWQFNTNVVFRSDGLLVARYHKQNLFFEEAFDTPPQPEIITFDTPFAGRFGLMICFDILFHEPTIALVERGVRQLIFPTAWMNLLPLLDSVQFQRAFSLGANVTLLAANLRKDQHNMRGSGIYTPFSATYYHAQRGDPEEGRLLVARVPVLDPLWVGQSVATEEGVVRTESTSSVPTGSGFSQHESCFAYPRPETASSVPPSTATFISSMMYDPFTFVLLNKTADEVNVCNGTFCCHLQYQRSLQGSGKELYALGAFAGTHIVDGRYALQVCAIVRCAGLDVSSCGQEVEEAESKMDFLLEGNFETRYVYPSVLASKFVLEQPEHLEMALDGRVTMKHSNMSGGLVTACLYGRMYHLDNSIWVSLFMSLHKETMFLFVVFSFSIMLAVVQTKPIVDSSYVAAVYEHNLILNPEPNVTRSRLAALQHMQKNLDIYEEQAARAAQQGAQILVFPEDGLQGYNFNRSSISGYLETIPDPQQESWNPCTEPDKHNNTEILRRLSCMARHNNLYLVANVADLQPCPLKTDSSSSSCPSDGRWQFNTNVVFRSDGLLVARYHKHNLYFEDSFDTPSQPEIITFETPFAGRFGLMICFDILFHEPTITLVERGVRQLILSTAWMNKLPLLDSVQFQRAFSFGANVTLLAANLRNDQHNMTGSGIYTPFSATYHHAQRGDPEEGRLLVARVPVLDPLWVGQSVAAGEGVVRTESTPSTATDSEQESCFDSPHAETASSVPPSSATFITDMMGDPFTFVLLKKTEGEVNVCHGTFCCHLQYKQLPQGSRKELYALGVFAGTHLVNGSYALQVCAIVRCAGLDVSSCGQEVEEAESKMDFLLEGNFGTRYVYPSVLASKYVLEQPRHLEKALDGRVTMNHSNMAGGLVTACLYGRMYHLDNK
ncbi:uncharacterized protein LOC119907789 [Micropterus salmoides]|uniref:uncharacterized protein LOC119907789 n=1 Tax=Micropterus salmoides TaxID=27706 RepID=UPI0018ED51FB|nr:uncharacterized protein LOC119907789 [Micropterus salmoides]